MTTRATDRPADGRAERARAIRDRVGLPPEVLGGAVLAGAPVLAHPLLAAAPAMLLELFQSGQPIAPTAYGQPIENIAQFSVDELRAIRRFAAAEKVDVPILGGAVTAYARPSAYDAAIAKALGLVGIESEPAAAPRISLGRSSIPQAMHEIAHASTPPLAPVWRFLVEASHGIPGMLGRGAIAAAALSPPDEDASRARRFVHDHAPALLAATFVPGLVEELRATAHALAGARRFGLGLAPALKELGPAFATHLGAAAAPVIGTALGQRLVQYLYDHADRPAKTAAQATEPRMSGELRAPAASVWHIGGYPKPKTTPPSSAGRPARPMPTAKPPSNRAYHTDVSKSLNDPARGTRAGVIPSSG